MRSSKAKKMGKKRKNNRVASSILQLITLAGGIGGMYLSSKVGIKILKEGEYSSFQDVVNTAWIEMFVVIGGFIIGGILGFIVGKGIIALFQRVFSK